MLLSVAGILLVIANSASSQGADQFPFVGELTKEGNVRWKCSVALIDPSWFLSSYKCLRARSASKLIVTLGTNFYRVQSCYGSEDKKFALFKINGSVQGVRPVSLPHSCSGDDYSASSMNFDSCSSPIFLTLGRKTSQKSELQAYRVFSQPFGLCSEQLSLNTFDNSQFCGVGVSSDQTPCNLDDGTVVVCQNPDQQADSYYFLLGVKSAQKCDVNSPNLPGTYYRVCPTLNWINATRLGITTTTKTTTTTTTTTTTSTPTPTTTTSTKISQATCPEPPALSNGNYINLIKDSDNFKVIRCSTGYVINKNLPTMVSCINGKWSPPGGCIPETTTTAIQMTTDEPSCPSDNPAVANGMYINSTDDRKKFLQCSEGFTPDPKSPSSIVCENGIWLQGGKCVPATKCPTPQIPHSELQVISPPQEPTSKMMRHWTRVSIKCRKRFEPVGFTRFTMFICKNGTWFPPVGSCQRSHTTSPTKTPAPTVITSTTSSSLKTTTLASSTTTTRYQFCVVPEADNGYYSYYGRKTDVSGWIVELGQKIELICFEGYRGHGFVESTCLFGQTWFPAIETRCVLEECIKDLPPVEFGYYAPSISNTIGSSQDVVCNDGYSLEGNRNVFCLQNGTWTLPGRCVNLFCGKPPTVFGVVYQSPPPAEKTRYKVGDTFRLRCPEGCIKGSSSVTCLKTGKWSRPGICQPVKSTCGLPPRFINGEINIPEGKSQFPLGTFLRIRCLPGYTSHFAINVIHCMSNGTWTKLPICYQTGGFQGCGNVPQIENGKVTEGPRRGHVVTCNLGYSLQGSSMVVKCQPNGNWSVRATCVYSRNEQLVKAAIFSDTYLLWRLFDEEFPTKALRQQAINYRSQTRRFCNCSQQVCISKGTPIHFAAACDKSNTGYFMSFLLDCTQTDVDLKDRNDRTALMIASAEGSPFALRHLIEKGAKVNFRNGLGETPLTMAAFAGKSQNVEYLIRKGANVNLRGKNNQTPIQLAAENNWRRIVSILLENGADPTGCQSPLCFRY